MTSLMLDVVNLQSWLPAIVQLFEARIHRQQQQLYILLVADLPPLTTNVAVLEQILIELLTYAYQQTPIGELITVSACVVKEAIQISISNSGIENFTPEPSRLFDSLCYLSQSNLQSSRSGLARAQELARQLGTAIQLENAFNQTTLTLQFADQELIPDRPQTEDSERIILLSGTKSIDC